MLLIFRPLFGSLLETRFCYTALNCARQKFVNAEELVKMVWVASLVITNIT